MATPPATTPDSKKTRNIFERVIQWFKDTAKWIPENLGDPDLAKEMRAELGLKTGQDIPPAQKGKFAGYGAGLDPDKESFAATAAEIADFVSDAQLLGADLKSPGQTAADAAYLLMKVAAADSLRVRVPGVYAVAKLVLFSTDDIEHIEELDPVAALKIVRGEVPSGEEWVQRIGMFTGAIVDVLELTVAKKLFGDNAVRSFYGWDPSPDSKTPIADLIAARALTMDIGRASEEGARALVTIIPVPTAQGGPGLFLSLGGALVEHAEIDNATYEFKVGIPGALYFFIPFNDLDRFRADGDLSAFFRLDVGQKSSDGPVFRMGEADATRLDVGRFEWGIELSKERAALRVAVHDVDLVVDFGKADGFLKAISGGSAKVTFDCGLVADSDGGVRLEGGTKGHVTLPVGRSIGPLSVHHVELDMSAGRDGADFGLDLTAGLGLNLGPFSAVVDRIGFRLDTTFGKGNLGFVDLKPGFLPPQGIGLRISGAVTGGGYLFIDAPRGEYSGAFELQIGKVGLKAFGILSTKVEGGTGWALLLFVYGQFPPMQLSFGFTLNGLGGMLGLQHGVDIQALIDGMRTGAFDDMLFPDNPTGNAPRVIERLRNTFPIRAGAFTLGPMVDLGWGTPRIVYIRLGIILQLDNVFGVGSISFSKLVLIGQLRVQIVPDEKKGINPVKLIVDILGFWDADQRRYGFLARLRDSKIGGVDITGSLAVYGEYGDHPRFVLAAGGFNPRFLDVPDAIKGVLDRLGASFKIGRFKILLQGYFAITPATVQAGASLTAKGEIGPVSLEGEIGFDLICYFEPRFHFITDFRVIVALKFHGHNLAGITLKGSIEGPGLWHIEGKATFSILWWDIDVNVNESWGDAAPVQEIRTNVSALLAAEVAKLENWSAQLPAGAETMVTFGPTAGATMPLAHPLGRFVFTQRVVPLGLQLQRFGSGQIDGPSQFDLDHVTVGVTSPTVIPPERLPAVTEQFCRSSFLDVSEDERLTMPSFEPMNAGVEFSAPDFQIPVDVTRGTLDYELAYLGVQPKSGIKLLRRGVLPGILDAAATVELGKSGAAGRAEFRATERMSAKVASRIAVVPPPLAAATKDSLTQSADVVLTGQATYSQSMARQAVKDARRADTVLVEAFELVGV